MEFARRKQCILIIMTLLHGEWHDFIGLNRFLLTNLKNPRERYTSKEDTSNMWVLHPIIDCALRATQPVPYLFLPRKAQFVSS